MKIKNILIIILAISLCLSTFVACSGDNDNIDTPPSNEPQIEENDDQDNGEVAPDDNNDSEEQVDDDQPVQTCAHELEEIIEPAMALKAGSKKTVCRLCGELDGEETVIPATKTLKVLALGNSFTKDGTIHLWNICKDAGIEELIVANLFNGGCSLDEHWGYITNNSPEYEYWENKNGEWTTVEKYKAIDGLKKEDWDIIVLHQPAQLYSGRTNTTFRNLRNVIDFVNENKTNPDARIVWHMPWANQADSTHASFAGYGYDQMTMYNKITEVVETTLVPTYSEFTAIIPSGTAIQNLRTSYVGDTVTRDGYHLSLGVGRYTAALTWFTVLTGGDPEAIEWTPIEYPSVDTYLSVIKESVVNATTTLFDVTQSAYPPSDEVIDDPALLNPAPNVILDPAAFYERDKALMAQTGINLDDYELLIWDYVENAYYNCTSRPGYNVQKEGSTYYKQDICTKNKYSTDTQVPAGTIFICDPGWRYRLEIYPNATSKYTGERPGAMTDSFYVLTDRFLNGCKYIAWDVTTDPQSDISAIYQQASAHIRVYVPKSA